MKLLSITNYDSKLKLVIDYKENVFFFRKNKLDYLVPIFGPKGMRGPIGDQM